MRETKFRYWDGEFKQMCDVRAIVWHNNMIANIEVFDSKTMFRNPNMFYEHALREFTGLHDDKRTKEYPEGQEIYEGDILSYGVWSDGRGLCLHKVIWNEEEAAFNTIENRQPYQVFSHVDTFNAEVIGDIYRNPELLETK